MNPAGLLAIPRRTCRFWREQALAFRVLLASTVLVPFSVLAISAWLAWGQVWRQAQTDLTHTVDIAAEHAAHLLDGHALLADRVDDLLRGLTDQQIREREAELHATLRNIAAAHPSVLSLYATDAEGRFLVGANVFPMPGSAAIRDRGFFKTLHEATPLGLSVSKVNRSQFNGEPFFAVAERRGAAADRSAAPGQDSASRGWILVTLRPRELGAALHHLTDEPQDIITLARTDGELLARSTGLGQAPSPVAAGAAAAAAAGTQRATVRERHDVGGVEHVAAFQRIKNWPAYVSAARPRAAVVAEWRGIAAWQAGFGGSAVAALAGLVLFASRRSRDAAEAHAALQVEAAGRAAAEALRESEERYRALSEATHEGVAILDGQFVIEVNEAFWRIFGYRSREQVVNRTCLDFITPALRQDMLGTLRHGRAEMHESIGLRADGSVFPAEFHGRPIQYRGRSLRVVLARDLTRRKGFEAALRENEAGLRELQAELLHVSRLSAAGEMASALAHELNQPLTAIASSASGALRLLQAAAPDGSGPGVPARALEAMARAAAQALRAGQIVARLREFVTKGEAERRAADIHELVTDAGTLALVGAKGQGVAVSMRIAPALPPVFVDRIQIQQVLINLIRNALDAMSEGDGTTCRELAVSVIPSEPEMVEVSVADTGPGLAPEVAGRLFEPFVTTKPDGMGVGLSISRSIVDAHGGRLWAENRPGGGTVFRFTLATVPEAGTL